VREREKAGKDLAYACWEACGGDGLAALALRIHLLRNSCGRAGVNAYCSGCRCLECRAARKFYDQGRRRQKVAA
jgi:hypothetical protein